MSTILEQAEQFFYFDDTLSESVERWCAERCSSFVGGEGQEHSLQHTLLFQEYCGFFESLLEGFLSNEGIDMVKFYDELRQQLDSCRTAKERGSTFGAVVLSAIDFSTFATMMNDVRCGRGFCFVPPLVEVEPEEMELADDKYGPDVDEDAGWKEDGAKSSSYSDYKGHK